MGNLFNYILLKTWERLTYGDERTDITWLLFYVEYNPITETYITFERIYDWDETRQYRYSQSSYLEEYNFLTKYMTHINKMEF